MAVEVAKKGLRKGQRGTWEAIASLAAAKALSRNAPVDVAFYLTSERKRNESQLANNVPMWPSDQHNASDSCDLIKQTVKEILMVHSPFETLSTAPY